MPYQFQTPESNAPTMGIYIHIPFCVKKCDYCDFYSHAPQAGEREAYQRALLCQIRQEAPKAAGRAVDTIYIGGGTPSCYGGERLAALLAAVREHYAVAPDCEITVECNPDTTTRTLLAQLKRAGVNRLSMGVQSASDGELRQVGRIHDFSTARRAVTLAREQGFDNLSLDLIYGLPGQSMASWQQSVEAVLALEPEHLSCYGLKLEEGTPLYDRRDSLALADDDAQADMYLWMVRLLEQAGYGQYEISNFARPGRHSRHNLRYWLGQEYLGFGPSAHSYANGRRYACPRDLDAFCRSGSDRLEETRVIDSDEQAREYVLLRLRTVRGICRAEYEARFGLPFGPLEQQFRMFAAHGWAEQDEGRWRFTPEGFLVSNALIGALLEAQEPQLQ